MTIPGSKSESERLRYLENLVNALIDAPLTSWSHNFWSDCWIFKLHTFLQTVSQDPFKSLKINLIWDHLKVAVLEGPPMALHGPPPRNLCWGCKKPQAPLDQKKKKKDFLAAYSLPRQILSFSPLFQTQKTLTTNQSLLILLFTKNTRYCPYTQSSFPWFYNLDLGFRGVDIAF